MPPQINKKTMSGCYEWQLWPVYYHLFLSMYPEEIMIFMEMDGSTIIISSIQVYEKLAWQLYS